MPQETIRVLTIEDNSSDARLIQEMLGKATALGWDLPHFELIRATRLAAGLACLDEGGIDVVLSDLDLPDSHAGDTFARLRAHGPHVPIVVLTRHEDGDLARDTVRAGAEDYLFKREMNGSLLAYALLYAIERQRARTALQEAHDTLERWVQERTADLELANAQLRQEIVERKQAEEALRQSRDLLATTEQIANVGGWEWDVARQTMTWTDETYRIHGFEPKELLPGSPEHIQRSLACYDPDDRQAIDAAFRRCAEEGEPYSLEFALTTAQGRRIWIQTMARPVLEGERVVKVLGNIVDITERKHTERTLQESEEKYRSLFNQSVWGIYLHDLEGRILDVNQTACLQSGYSRDELLQLTVFDLHPDKADTVNLPRDEILRQWSQWQPEQRSTVQAEHQHKDGTIVPVEISTGVIRYGGRNLMLAMIQDITERKRAAAEREKLQAQLAQAQKMEAVGRLAGGVAHDFNNMLGVIMGHAELATQQIDPSHPLHSDLAEIHQAAQRSAALTRQLLAFARKQIITPRVLNLNDTVVDMLKMLRRLIGEDIDLAWVPGAELWPVKIDPGQFNQILINLCLNARDAIGGSGRLGVGTITVETQNVVCDESYSTDRAEFVPGEYVQLAVSDDGCGMDKDVLKNLFEPYFTTKAESQSGGLGLATVYGAVKMNQGFIHVYSEPDQGTTFKIYLPRSTGQAVTIEPPRPSVQGGRETVLLVEDEPAVLRLARTMLGYLGYIVLAAGRPGEALCQAAEYAGTIDLLITDVVMPEMNGQELAARIGAGHPGLKCLYMSGYTANVVAHQGVLDEGVWFLQKPFSIDELAVKVREVLDDGGGLA